MHKFVDYYQSKPELSKALDTKAEANNSRTPDCSQALLKNGCYVKKGLIKQTLSTINGIKWQSIPSVVKE